MPQLGTQQAITNGRFSAYSSVDAPLEQRIVVTPWTNGGKTTVVGEILTVLQVQQPNKARQYERSNGTKVWSSAIQYNNLTEAYPPVSGSSLSNAYALSFNGSSDYVSTPAGTLGLTGATAMTLSFWFKSNTAGEGPSIGSRTGFTDQWGFLRSGGANYVQVVTQSNGGYFTYASPSDTNYHHYALTYSAGASFLNLELYIDGSVVSHTWQGVGTSIPATLHSANVGFDIGRNHTFYSHGLMDEVSIFGSELSSTDVTAIYNNGPNDIGTSGLNLNPFGWWRCGDDDGGTGSTITNQGSKTLANGTVHGASFSTIVP